MLTAYDATMAKLLDLAGIDVLLVGDSLGHVILGLDTTIPVTLDAVIHHTLAVTRGANRALVVADMPFLTSGRRCCCCEVGRRKRHCGYGSKAHDCRAPCYGPRRADPTARASAGRNAATGT